MSVTTGMDEDDHDACTAVKSKGMVSGLVHLDTAPDAAMALHEGINEMALKETSPLSSPTSPTASNNDNEQSDNEQMPCPVNLVMDVNLVAELNAFDGKHCSGKLLMITLHVCLEILTLSFQSAHPKHQSAPCAAPHSKPKPIHMQKVLLLEVQLLQLSFLSCPSFHKSYQTIYAIL
jgi:hypothetical protein